MRKKKRGSNTVFLQVSMTFKLTLNKPKTVFVLLLRKKDSKSRTKINSSPGLIRAYVRTYGRTYGRGRPPNFLALMGLPISMGMELRPRAPSAPAGAPLLASKG